MSENLTPQFSDDISSGPAVIRVHAGDLSSPEVPTPRDPYPSRAGWRADFLLPYDPNVKEKESEAGGKIGAFDIVQSTTTFNDIGGNPHAKEALQEIAHQLKEPRIYEQWDVPLPKGVLLYGPPGTGKTMLARAFAREAGAALVEVPVAALSDRYQGQAVKNLKEIFDKAVEYGKPIVLYFDKIDSLLPDCRYLLSNDSAEMVNAFLQAVDGLKSAKNIIALGATNHPECLDPAAIQPGCFDQKIEVYLPDKLGCQEILVKQLLASECSTGQILAEDDLDLDKIGENLAGLSGAEIAEILNRVKRTMVQSARAIGKAAIFPGREGVCLQYTEGDRGQIRIATQDIVTVATNYRLAKQI